MLTNKHKQRQINYETNPARCARCNKALLYKYRWNKYCSHSCSAIQSNTGRKIVRKDANPNKHNCACGKRINKKNNMCLACRNKYYQSLTIGDYRNKENVKGKHPSWVHGAIRSFARRWHKDLEKSCINCGYSKHVEVCHIKSLASFQDSALLSEVNARENLIVLCPNCHWEFDNKLLLLPL